MGPNPLFPQLKFLTAPSHASIGSIMIIGSMRVGLILDSNYFLHYRGPESIRWNELVSGTTEIRLLVIPPVVDEIDRKKWNGKTSKEKNRARDVTSKLKKWFLDNQPPSLANGIGIDRVRKQTLPQVSGLDQETSDDQIILYSLELSKEFDKTIIVTHDFGLQDRAKDHGLDYMELDDIYALADELDPMEKELATARKELQKFRDRTPKLNVLFSSRELHQKFKLQPVAPLTKKELIAAGEQIRVTRPLNLSSVEKADVAVDKDDLAKQIAKMVAGANSAFGPSAADWARYNENLNSFYKKYEKYLLEKNAYDELCGRTLEIELVLENIGTSPASNINIALHFPISKTASLVLKRDFPDEPEAPSAPSKPKGFLENFANQNGIGNFNHSYFNLPVVAPRAGRDSVSDPSIRPTNSFDVEFNVDALQHLQQKPAKKMRLTFPSIDAAESFQISWTAISNEQPEPQTGTLDVIILK